MDFVDGGSLRDVLADGGPLPPSVPSPWWRPCSTASRPPTRQGILHRDLKPDNVLLTSGWQDLAPGSVRLTDFGISRMVADGAGTTTGLMGTPEYMAPELLVTGTCDLSADVYGTGILLYELLAGRTPFAGPGTDYSVAHRHVASVPPPLEVPEALARQLDAMLAKDPTARPGAAEAAAGLKRLVPALAGLPALAVQAASGRLRQRPRPDDDAARGRSPSRSPPPSTGATDDEPYRPSSLDLGTPDPARCCGRWRCRPPPGSRGESRSRCTAGSGRPRGATRARSRWSGRRWSCSAVPSRTPRPTGAAPAAPDRPRHHDGAAPGHQPGPRRRQPASR